MEPRVRLVRSWTDRIRIRGLLRLDRHLGGVVLLAPVTRQPPRVLHLAKRVAAHLLRSVDVLRLEEPAPCSLGEALVGEAYAEPPFQLRQEPRCSGDVVARSALDDCLM